MKLLLRLLRRKHARLLSSFLCMMVISATVMLFVFAKIDARAYSINSYNRDLCTFTIQPSDDHLSSVQAYISLIRMYTECEIKPQEVRMVLQVPEAENPSHTPYVVLPFGEKAILAAYQIPAQSWNRSVLYAASAIEQQAQVHDGMVTVCGYDLHIAAMKYPSEIGYSVVSLNAAVSYDLPIARVDIVYPLLDDRSALTAQYDVLNLYWHDAVIKKPVDRDYNLEEQAQSDGYLADAVFALLLCAELYFYSYIIKSILAECCILRLIGMSKRRLIGTFLLLSLCISVGSAAAAIGIYRFALYPLLLHTEPIFRYVDSNTAYYKLLVISMCQVVLLCLANLALSPKMNIVKILRENRI